jgi:hypothetical protein
MRVLGVCRISARRPDTSKPLACRPECRNIQLHPAFQRIGSQSFAIALPRQPPSVGESFLLYELFDLACPIAETKYGPCASSSSGPQVGTLLARSDRHAFDLFLPSSASRIQGVPVIETSSAASAIKLGYFFARSKNFLWKSPDRVEKILRMRASEDYNQLPAQNS